MCSGSQAQRVLQALSCSRVAQYARRVSHTWALSWRSRDKSRLPHVAAVHAHQEQDHESSDESGAEPESSDEVSEVSDADAESSDEVYPETFLSMD